MPVAIRKGVNSCKTSLQRCCDGPAKGRSSPSWPSKYMQYKHFYFGGVFIFVKLTRMSKVSHDSETLAQGQQVITACAFIHRIVEGEEKVFLPKRADTKKFLPGKYELPGGHIDYGEDIEVGLIREIREELGVAVTLGDPFAVFTYTNEVKGSHSVEVVYFAHLIEDPDRIQIDPDVHSSSGWFTETEAVSLNDDSEDKEVAVIKKGFALLHSTYAKSVSSNR